jgi:hypothetical protein
LGGSSIRKLVTPGVVGSLRRIATALGRLRVLRFYDSTQLSNDAESDSVHLNKRIDRRKTTNIAVPAIPDHLSKKQTVWVKD